MSKTPAIVVDRLHELTHRVPGVPEHPAEPVAGHQGRSVSSNRKRLHAHPRQLHHVTRHDTPPRVLVAWQEWIGRLVGRER